MRSTLNPEQDLLCLRLILKKDPEALAGFLARGFDFQAFQRFCERHLLSGYVYSTLNAIRAGALFPEGFMERAKRHFMNQWAVNERLILEMEKISGLFFLDGIDVLFLKGPFLAERFYEQGASRVTRDVDILVRHADIDRADKILLANGFERRSNLLLGKQATIRFTHHFEYSKAGVKVELHWVLARHFSFRIDYENLWAQNHAFLFRKNNYRVLAEDQELVMQFLSIFTDIPLGTLALKQFADVYHIVKKLDYDCAAWKRFLEDRKKEGLLLISINVLDLVLSVLGCAGDFPALAAVLEEHQNQIRLKDPVSKEGLWISKKVSWKNRLWAFRLCEANIFQSVGWWAVSLPFRLLAYPGWTVNFFNASKVKKKLMNK